MDHVDQSNSPASILPMEAAVVEISAGSPMTPRYGSMLQMHDLLYTSAVLWHLEQVVLISACCIM